MFSCYKAETNGNSWEISFETEEDYKVWLDSIIEKSLWSSTTKPEVSDKIVTFSTCTNNSSDTRFILHGIITEL